MAIDFPSNPVAGQTYPVQEYGTSLDFWRYNGVAWDKVKLAEDSWALWGVSGEQYLGELQTGILYGGVLSINAGNSATFDYTAGAGFIANPGATLTALPEPTGQRVTWAGATGVTLTYLASSDTTWLRINSSGSLIQSASAFTNGEYQDSIVIGALVHPSRSYINLARTFPITAYGSGEQYEIFIRSFGALKLSGHVIEASGTAMRLSRTSGKAFALGRNYTNNPNYPSVITDGNYTNAGIFRYYRGVTSGSFITVPNQTVIDPGHYDNGSGTLQTVSGGQYTIQRIFYFPAQTNILGVYYGRQTYNSMDNARANLFFEEFSEIENTLYQAIFCSYLIVKGNATDLTNPADAQFIQAGLFRNTSSGGGGLSVTALDDLSDVTITSPTNDQVLTYESAQWVNRAISSIGVSRFNGLTGSVTGVGSIRGLTGAVGLTNGSGIGLSVSGNTLTISNTGVLSIDGSTGAITNVARTNVANTFNQTQSIEGVGSLGSSYLTEYGGSGITFNFDTGIDTGSQRWTAGLGGGANTTITFPNDTGTLALTKNVVSSFNGLTGAVTGVTTGTANTFGPLQSFTNGISSAGGTFSALTRFTAGISASGGMTLSGTVNLNGQTFTNVVTSVNGSTGAITNVARTNVNNNFSETQTIIGDQKTLAITHFNPSPFSLKYLTIEPYNNRIMYQDPIIGSLTYLTFDSSTVGNFTVNVPNYSTTLAGLAGTQTFTGTNTFNALTNFNAGISSAGGTFSGNINLKNAEYIQNTTNGRIDFMPAPGGSTHYGLYVDTTSWGFGPRLGTIRSSDSALNTAGILWDAPLTIGSNTRFNLTSDSSHAFLVTTTGNDTLQVGIRINSSVYSGAMALVDDSVLGAANRSPGVTHANPNLYIYRAGSARATDFIRLEHDGNTGYMISGGTSDIELMPGSGIVGVSGNIQVLQNQIYVTNNARSWFL